MSAWIPVWNVRPSDPFMLGRLVVSYVVHGDISTDFWSRSTTIHSPLMFSLFAYIPTCPITSRCVVRPTVRILQSSALLFIVRGYGTGQPHGFSLFAYIPTCPITSRCVVRPTVRVLQPSNVLFCSRSLWCRHGYRSGMSDLVTLSCWGAVLSGLGKFHWPDLDLVPRSVGVAYGDRRSQWAWSRSAVKQSRSRTVLWAITQYLGFYTTCEKCRHSLPHENNREKTSKRRSKPNEHEDMV